MKPLYAPFTYASPEVTEFIRHWAGPFLILQPVAGNAPDAVQEGEAAGAVEVLTPVEGGEERILAAVKKFRHWGELHQGQMDAFKAASASGFYNEDFAAEIRSDILRGGSRPSASEPVDAARMFLALAQEFDIEQKEVEDALQESEMRQKKLFSALRGEETTALPLSERRREGAVDDPLAENRIPAWLRLLCETPAPPGVWITTSREVFSYLQEFAFGFREVGRLDPIPGDPDFRASLIRWIGDGAPLNEREGLFARGPGSSHASAGDAALTVAALAAASPRDLLDALLAGKASEPLTNGARPGIVVCLLEKNG
jgi:hypothetical protein